jgi:Lon protease-like protein
MTIQPIEIPSEAPVMVLSSTLLFPNALMPLYIFEPRYREMLRWALEHDRAFCVALRKPGTEDTVKDSDFFHTAGLGMIRACVTAPDGTSHLMLHGMARVRFEGFTKKKPFRIAKLAVIPPEHAPIEETEPIVAEIRTLCERFRDQGMTENIESFLFKMKDHDQLADAVAHSLVQAPLRRQQILEEPRLLERLKLVAAHLDAETANNA